MCVFDAKLLRVRVGAGGESVFLRWREWIHRLRFSIAALPVQQGVLDSVLSDERMVREADEPHTQLSVHWQPVLDSRSVHLS